MIRGLINTDIDQPVIIRNGSEDRHFRWQLAAFQKRLFESDLSSIAVPWRVTGQLRDLPKGSDSNGFTTCNTSGSHRRSIMEYQSEIIIASFRSFYEWNSNIGKSISPSNPFLKFGRDPTAAGIISVYADYLYFAKIFEDLPSLPTLGNWSELFEDPNDISVSPEDLTLWVGTRGAHSPLHYDTYGNNVVLQVSGTKRWQLWKPCHPQIPSRRIPYEESSVYSHHDPLAHQSITPDYDLILEPGDVLFVPKHWWHFVSTESDLSISVNAWLPHPDDCEDRASEALVKLIFGSLRNTMREMGIKGVDDPKNGWISPSEVGIEGKPDEVDEDEDEDEASEASLHWSYLLQSLDEVNQRCASSYSKKRKAGAVVEEESLEMSANKEDVMRIICDQILCPDVIKACIDKIIGKKMT